MGIDVVSSGELYTALKAGFPMEKVFFHGNNKTDFDINFAIENKIGYFVCDNLYELEAIDKIAENHGIIQKILLRAYARNRPSYSCKNINGKSRFQIRNSHRNRSG